MVETRAMTRRSRSVALLVALATVLALLIAAPAAPARATGGDPKLQALLDALVAKGASGALAVVDDGKHTTRLASGLARVEPRQRLRPNARFRIGSVTKTFVATLALQLVGEGKLRLDDTVERWLPGLVPNGKAITLRMLLNHTSGLYDYDNDLLKDPAVVRRFADDSFSPVRPRAVVALATAHRPDFAPGAGWAYSSTGYVVAGLMLEAATGRRVEPLMRNHVLEPLRLTHTSFPTRPGIAGYHAHGYARPATRGDLVDVTRYFAFAGWTDGAMISTADDLRRFYAELLGGRLLPPRLLAEMMTTVSTRGRDLGLVTTTGYGLGLFTMSTPCGTMWGHQGGVPGYLTWAFSDRSGQRGIVVMIPTSDPGLVPLIKATIATAATAALHQASGRQPAHATSRSLAVRRPTPPARRSLAGGDNLAPRYRARC